MDKVMLAINHKQTEEEIKKQIQQTHVCVGIATYRESVVPSLKECGATILLLREDIGGSLKIPLLIRQIRTECPHVRIIIITKERDKRDPFLAMLVSFGIYDIINADIVNVKTIVSYIMAPRSFRDVSQYFRLEGDLDYVEAEEPQKPEKKPSGGLFGFGGGKSSKKNNTSSRFTASKTESANVDLASMRAVMQEEADRRAMQKVDELVQEAAKNATKELQQKLSQSEETISDLRVSLQAKTSQEESVRMELDRSKVQCDDLTRQIASLKKTIHDQSSMVGSTTPKSASDTNILQMERKIESLQSQLVERNREISNLKDKLSQVPEAAVSTAPAQQKKNPFKEIFKVARGTNQVPFRKQQVITCLGAKHGTGNTTVALSLATYLALSGYKTLLIELNGSFPLLPHYFNFSLTDVGADSVCKKNTPLSMLKSAIIDLQCLPAKPALKKVYHELPTGLHFILFSNQFMLAQKLGQKYIPSAEDWGYMLYNLKKELEYTYIIIDIQPDNPAMVNLFLNHQLSDRLVLMATQDIHSLAITGSLKNELEKTGNMALIENTSFILNKFSASGKLKKDKISAWLGVDDSRISCLSFDLDGYRTAEMAGIPYVLTNGAYVTEYQTIAQDWEIGK